MKPIDAAAAVVQSWALASYFGPPIRIAAVSLACLVAGVGCAAIDKLLGGEDTSQPTDLQHDPLQGGGMENSSQERPLFLALDGGRAAADRALVDQAAAQGVVDAVGGTSP